MPGAGGGGQSWLHRAHPGHPGGRAASGRRRIRRRGQVGRPARLHRHRRRARSGPGPAPAATSPSPPPSSPPQPGAGPWSWTASSSPCPVPGRTSPPRIPDAHQPARRRAARRGAGHADHLRRAPVRSRPPHRQPVRAEPGPAGRSRPAGPGTVQVPLAFPGDAAALLTAARKPVSGGHAQAPRLAVPPGVLLEDRGQVFVTDCKGCAKWSSPASLSTSGGGQLTADPVGGLMTEYVRPCGAGRAAGMMLEAPNV